MIHEKYEQLITLSLYNELTAAEQEDLNTHLQSCTGCYHEYEEQKRLHLTISKNKIASPSGRLLNEARRELEAALRVERTKASYWSKLKEKLQLIFTSSYSLALGGAAVLLIGFFLGYLFFDKKPGEDVLSNQLINDNNSFAYLHENVQISNVRFIDSDASDGEVEFIFEAVKPVRIKGSLQDANIQSILAYSMVNEQNPGIRLNTINALGSNNLDRQDPEIKEALISVVKFDENPGVRREAIQLLKKMKYDEDIKQAFLFVLKNDTVSGLRIEAINSLLKARKEGYQFDEEAISILKEKLRDDENNYIRYQAKTVLQEQYQ